MGVRSLSALTQSSTKNGVLSIVFIVLCCMGNITFTQFIPNKCYISHTTDYTRNNYNVPAISCDIEQQSCVIDWEQNLHAIDDMWY